MPLLAHVFEQENAFDKLERFTSLNGPAFYRLPVNTETLTLTKSDQKTIWPKNIETPQGPVTLFDPGFDVHWSVAD